MCEKNPTEANITRRKFVRRASLGVAGLALLAHPLPAVAYDSSLKKDFVDDLGRKVSLTLGAGKIVPYGACAQDLITTLCPDALASLFTDVNQDIEDYCKAGIAEYGLLPKINHKLDSSFVEKIMDVNPDFILDAGVPKSGLISELDDLQKEIGIPVFFLDISFGSLSSAYRTLGEVLNNHDRAETLAAYVDEARNRVGSLNHGISKGCNVLYAPKENGLILKSSVTTQLQVMSFIGATPVVNFYDFDSGTICLDMINNSDIDLIVFDDTDCLDSLVCKTGESYNIWKRIDLIQKNRFIVSPALMHSWFGSMVLSQTIGMLWLAHAIWPQTYNYDLIDEAERYYSLFYSLEKEESDLKVLVGKYIEAGYAHE